MGDESFAFRPGGQGAQLLEQGTAVAAPLNDTESALCEIFATVAGVEQISADDHFFEQLNADSMLMAHFCARVRKHPNLPSVSMKDIYRHPTVRELAGALRAAQPAASTEPGAELVTARTPPPPVEVSPIASTAQYVLCGTLQLVCFLTYAYLAALALTAGYGWISTGAGVVDLYLRSVVVGGLVFAAVCTLPIVAKWVLVGRWRPQRIQVWSLGYFRFWLVKVLVRANPLVLMVGSPIYVLYLRALGAKIGPGVAIFSAHVPVCTDLLAIGADTVIRKDSHFDCYRAYAGAIEMAPVTLGRNVLVSEATVLDIGTTLGDGAQLGHASSLHLGQSVPDGERWHGSPAQPTDVDFRGVEPVPSSRARGFCYGLWQLVTALGIYLPLSVGGLAILLEEAPVAVRVLGGWAHVSNPVVQVLVTSLVAFLGVVLLTAGAIFVVPRILAALMVPDRVYPLYGFHYSLHHSITRLTNVRFFNELFGNSSYVVPYLHRLGYDVSREEQTGSNFGTEFKHETPFLVSIGRGTMIADGLSLLNAEYSSTSFKVTRTSIGAHSFLGNSIVYPARGRTGENVLLATKVMVPIDGKIREGVGLLGSPAFEIPRSVERDGQFDGHKTQASLAAKNRHNAQTMAMFLVSRWIEFLALTSIFYLTERYAHLGALGGAVDIVIALVFSLIYFGLLERAAANFQPLSPQFCSIYDPYFWWHERYWKFAMNARLVKLVDGTPFKNLLSRALGARVGRRVFDDGCGMPERTMVTIGDDCTLSAGSGIQCHSQEDGSFKSDRVQLGSGCTLGAGTLVHYGTTVGDGVVLAPDTFLMKGTEALPGTFWSGNPAHEIEPETARPVLTAGHRVEETA